MYEKPTENNARRQPLSQSSVTLLPHLLFGSQREPVHACAQYHTQIMLTFTSVDLTPSGMFVGGS